MLIFDSLQLSKIWIGVSHLLAISGTVRAVANAKRSDIIDRQSIVSRYNPVRTASSDSTPMQVGNGNFAFGADITGLQTFQPFAIMSSWGWKNDSFPPGRTLEDILAYTGESLDNHGRNVSYMFGGVADIQQWLISNPNRVSLGRVGLWFGDGEQVAENDLQNKTQTLDLWSGVLNSSFMFNDSRVDVTTVCDQDADVVGVSLTSSLVSEGGLGLFLDFPWNDGSSKFEAPFVGMFNMSANHSTDLTVAYSSDGTVLQATIIHTMVNNSFITSIVGSGFNISQLNPTDHKYIVMPSNQAGNSTFEVSISYTTGLPPSVPTFEAVLASSAATWESYWSTGGFVDVVSDSTDTRAVELQRRIILSQYLLRLNEAGDLPPQESGLVNNGWYGKFHMEMFYWHCIHWALWSQWDLFHRSSPTYSAFLATSYERAQIQQGWPTGARWSKMTDPTGRSAPGEINELLIWQQVHPLVFAEYEYRAFPSSETLETWSDVVEATADWMSAFAFFNDSTGVNDLGPPMYIVSEDTQPLVTTNPSFELAYWSFGLSLAETWMQRLGREVPSSWTDVRENLDSLPIENGTYMVYEGIESDFWDDTAYTNSHPSLVGLYGWLPETPKVDPDIANATMQKVVAHWNVSNFWGWDFGMLAMSAARNGEPDLAVSWLLNDVFAFDDVGMPSGGAQVPTPYFPGSGSLLLAIAMMAGGWDGSTGDAPGFPSSGWGVRAEGINPVL